MPEQGEPNNPDQRDENLFPWGCGLVGVNTTPSATGYVHYV